MFRMEAGDDPVGGYDVEYIQPLDCGSDQGIVSFFARLGSRDVGVSLFEREEIAELKILDIAVAVAANRRKRDRRLNIDVLLKGPRNASAESVRASAVVKCMGGRGHR